MQIVKIPTFDLFVENIFVLCLILLFQKGVIIFHRQRAPTPFFRYWDFARQVEREQQLMAGAKGVRNEVIECFCDDLSHGLYELFVIVHTNGV